MFRFLDKQPLARDLVELQAQVDAFDEIYNHQRPHQALPGRITPAEAWQATPVATAPRPSRDQLQIRRRPRPRPIALPPQLPSPLGADTIAKKLSGAGTFMLDQVHYKVDGRRAYEDVLVITDGPKLIVTDPHGEVLITHTRPPAGVIYVGNGRPRGPRTDPRDPQDPSPMS